MSMSELKNQASADQHRRRTFFTSKLVIKTSPPKPILAGPSSAILSALAPPRTAAPSSSSVKPIMAYNTQDSRPTSSPLASGSKNAHNTGPDKGNARPKEKGSEKQVSSSSITIKQIAIGKPESSWRPTPTSTPTPNSAEPVKVDKAAKARRCRIEKLAREREERKNAPVDSEPTEPRRTRQSLGASSTANEPAEASNAPPRMLKMKRVLLSCGIETWVVSEKMDAAPLKEYMESGFYCQDDRAKAPYTLVSKVLKRREAEEKSKSRKTGTSILRVIDINRPIFPPLPYDYGHELFFGEQHDFTIPFNIRQEAESGRLDRKKRPAAYSKLRANVFPERSRMQTSVRAVCECKPDSGCGTRCINVLMSYLCGRDCPCGDKCTNRSLAKRKGPKVEVFYTESRGFGLMAMEDIDEGHFVIDYRGEIIALDTYHERCKNEYAVSKNFYALAYNQDEVIDAGARGNEARFINHSCNPNLVVQRFQALGDGQEEYEVGMWASRDILAGEELSYDYNFDAFGVSEGDDRVKCRCGSTNCIGYLGRQAGGKSNKQIALDIEADKASRAKVAQIKEDQEAKEASDRLAPGRNAVAGPSQPTAKTEVFWQSRDTSYSVAESQQTAVPPSKKARLSDPSTHLPTPESRASSSSIFDIPPAVNFRRPLTLSPKKKQSRQSLPNPSRPIQPARSPARNEREPSPVPLFVRHTKKQKEAMKEAIARGRTLDVPGPSALGAANTNSGWANWLRNLAGKEPRTEESWRAFRLERRKGEGWISSMIQEYGMLPSKSHPGQVGSVVTQEMLNATRRELEAKGVSWKGKGVGDGKPNRPKKRKSEPMPVTAAPLVSENRDGDERSDSEDEEDAAARRLRAKQEAIIKRNGAPMGWVYVPVGDPPAQAVDAVPTDLPPRRPRSKTISYAE